MVHVPVVSEHITSVGLMVWTRVQKIVENI